MSTTYLVFARRQADEALTAVGSLEAPRQDQLQTLARERFGSEWLEVIAIPRSTAAWAIEEEK